MVLREKKMRKDAKKRVTSFVLAVLMITTTFMGNFNALTVRAAEAGWQEVAFDQITAEDSVMITMSIGGTNYALPNSMANETGPRAVVFSETSELSKTDYSFYVTTVDDKYEIKNPDGLYLYVTATNNGIRINSNPQQGQIWTMSDGVLSAEASDATRYLSIYSTNSDWRCYKNTNNANTLKFYKWVGESDSTTPPSTETEETTPDDVNSQGEDSADPTPSVTPLPTPDVKPSLEAGSKVETLEAGTKVVAYINGNVLTNVVNGKKLSSAAASISDQGILTIAAPEKEADNGLKNGIVELLVEEKTVGDETCLAFKNSEGLYLTSGATGNGISFAAAPAQDAVDYTLWTLESNEDKTVNVLVNKYASYTNTKTNVTYREALEFYGGAFTTYNYTDIASLGNNEAAYNVSFYAMPEIPEDFVEDSAPEETAVFAKKSLSIGDEAEFVILYNKDNQLLTSTASGSKLAGTAATFEEDGSIKVTKDMALLTAVEEDGAFLFVTKDGKYLTSGATGSALTLADAKTDYAYWNAQTTDEADGVFFINKNAKYGSSNRYLEYYTGFTTYSYKSASHDAYVFTPDVTKPGAVSYAYDTTVSSTLAQWAGNANYEAEGITTAVPGDLYATNDLKDRNSKFTAVVSGANVKTWTSGTSSTTGSTSYYMGATGLGSGTDDYMQMELSSKGFGKMAMSFRLRASNTGAGSFKLKYSTDGTSFYDFNKGSYSYAYTDYSGETPNNVSKEGTVSDGVAKTSYNPGNYVNFNFDIPASANNADKLYIRLVPGTEAAKSSSKLSSSGVVRIDSVVITGSPIIDDNITGFVKAAPASGEIALGSELTLSSATEGAKIHYSVNGSDFAVYKSDSKPVISELPANVVTYASKEGLADSVKMVYQYTQSKVASVKASPNGGAVVNGTVVNLKCETEGAVIKYAFVDSEDAEVTEWITYDKALVIDGMTETQGKILKVMATKTGYLDSPVSTLKFTKRLNEKYNIYFGQIHSHSNYSDGAGTCEEAFAHARTVDNLDFLAVTDHSNSLDNASEGDITKNVDKAATDEWTMGHTLAKQYSTSDFTCMYGYEMTWSNGLGHMNTFNTPGFQSRTQTAYSTFSTALENYYRALEKVPDSISMFNHPGSTFGDFQDFAYYTEERDNLITLLEVGNGEGAVGSSGYFPSYEYYQRALDKGWHVAPTNNQDNHKGLWGDANTARSVVLADSNTEDAIYDAMRNYRVYATEDNDLSVYYTLNGYIMGTILEAGYLGDTAQVKVDLKDPTDAIKTVQVIANGGIVVAEKSVNAKEASVEFSFDNNYSYYYVRVVEDDKDIAVTAPVWVGDVEACGINSTYTNSVIAVQNESLDLNVEIYNNESEDLVINSINITVGEDNKEVVSKTGEEAGIAAVAPNSTATFTTNYSHDGIGSTEYQVTIHATLNGVEKVYKDTLKLSYTTPDLVTEVIIDGTHFNDYVTGYYGGNMSNFVKLAGEKNIRVNIENNEITKEMLENCALLMISAPAKKSGTANAGEYSPKHYSEEFLAMVAEYVANGGSVVVCGLADYQDSTTGQTATEQNKLLEAIGSTIKMNSDEVYDEVNNGGQAYRLYPTNFNEDSQWLKGIKKGQTYSQYSGCSVDVSNAVATDKVNAAESLVKGFDTTYSIDCKDAAGASAGNAPFDNKGNVTFLASQTTKAGGTIFVAGGVFLSDFEVKAEIDNPDSLPYANYTIAQNILKSVEKKLPVSSIAEVRKAKLGEVFAVEGWVTAGTDNEYTTFFDSIYIQDDTAGIDIFPYATAGLALGAKMRITGYVDEYQGDRELQVISAEILEAEPKVIEAKVLTTKQATDYDSFGGCLVKTTGVVTRIVYGTDGKTISEFWVKDDSGVEAAVFIDGYINSAKTGKNEINSFVKLGATVTGQGLLYKHPEGSSDVSVPVLRVRNVDEIVLVKAEPQTPSQPVVTTTPSSNVSTTVSGSESQASAAEGIAYVAPVAANQNVAAATQVRNRTTAAAQTRNEEIIQDEQTSTTVETEGTVSDTDNAESQTAVSTIKAEEVPLAAGEIKSSEEATAVPVIPIVIGVFAAVAVAGGAVVVVTGGTAGIAGTAGKGFDEALRKMFRKK